MLRHPFDMHIVYLLLTRPSSTLVKLCNLIGKITFETCFEFFLSAHFKIRGQWFLFGVTNIGQIISHYIYFLLYNDFITAAAKRLKCLQKSRSLLNAWQFQVSSMDTNSILFVLVKYIIAFCFSPLNL